MKIYLSGGMYSGWQDKMPMLDGVDYFDPRNVKQKSAYYFVNKEIEFIRQCNLVFCYIEKDNPSGLGAAWECATAFENNVPIITVWEKDYIDPFFACNSLYLLNDFQEGIKKLKSFVDRSLQ